VPGRSHDLAVLLRWEAVIKNDSPRTLAGAKAILASTHAVEIAPEIASSDGTRALDLSCFLAPVLQCSLQIPTTSCPVTTAAGRGAGQGFAAYPAGRRRILGEPFGRG
jgi:hypothetical protein